MKRAMVKKMSCIGVIAHGLFNVTHKNKI